jgi:cell fate regulator YaaT (PSP1 superfamily)
MAMAVEVRFREVGKIYSFAPGELNLKRGDHVVVETAKGVEYGTVVIGNHEREEKSTAQPLKEVIRKATPEDDKKVAENLQKEKDAFVLGKKKIAEHKLDMKLIAVEYAFDGTKITFYFTSDERVDFRDLVKDLASLFKSRIELRQVGVRDETKIAGGMGSCGRQLCCSSYLTDFVPVSIRMAKEQNLSLNPQKISGVCGRLMCCLKNEAETYAYLNSKLPKKGDVVETADKVQGEVTELDVLRQKVKLLVTLSEEEREIVEVPAEGLTVLSHRKKGQPGQPRKELRALKMEKDHPKSFRKPENGTVKSAAEKAPAENAAGEAEKGGTEKPAKPGRPSRPQRPAKADRPDRPLRPQRPDRPERPQRPDRPERPVKPLKPVNPDAEKKIPEEPEDPLKPKHKRTRHHRHRGNGTGQQNTGMTGGTGTEHSETREQGTPEKPQPGNGSDHAE